MQAKLSDLQAFAHEALGLTAGWGMRCILEVVRDAVALVAAGSSEGEDGRASVPQTEYSTLEDSVCSLSDWLESSGGGRG